MTVLVIMDSVGCQSYHARKVPSDGRLLLAVARLGL